jgi:hypothetical protein
MNYSCILCGFVLVEIKYRYLVSGRSSFNILDAIKSLPFNVNVNGQSYVCRTCFAPLKNKNGLEEAYDKCLKELRETVENVCAGYFQTDVQPLTSTPIIKTAHALFNPVYVSPQVEVQKHNNDKTSSKTSVLVG